MRTMRRRAPDAGVRRSVARIGVPAVLGGLLLLYAALLLPHAEEYSFAVDGVFGNVVLALPAAVCLGRAALVRAQRSTFLLIGLACAAFTGGNLAYVFHVQFLDPLPYPSVADVGYLAPYPLLLVAVWRLAAPELRNLPQGVLLDGALGALSVAAAGSIITVAPLLDTLGGSALTQVVGAAYPVADLTLAATIAGIVTLKGGRVGRTWLWLGSGVVTFGVADTIYLYRVATDTYAVGTPLDGLWALGLTLMAMAAAVPYDPGGRRSGDSPRALVLPNVFALLAVGVLAYGSLQRQPLPVYAVALTLAAMFTSVKRTAVGFNALRRLAQIEQLARTDELTQLPNRRHFDEQGQQRLAARGPEERFALILLDLDGFAAVNTTSGHHAGDELLRQVGPRLREEVRVEDLLARLGGDEFGVLLAVEDREEAMAVAGRLACAVTRPFLVDGAWLTTAAALGVALCPEDGVDLAVLVQRADAALSDAKRNRLGLTAYDADRHGRGHDRLDVRTGIAEGELVAHYQPQFDLASGGMSGVEALVRWQHPERGLLYPDVFLPFVEQAGLMPELTLAVLELGARDWRRWHLDGRTLELSVNLAPSALLRDDLIDSITAVLGRHGMPPQALTLEITENVLVVDSVRSLRTLTGLRSLGIQLSLDDYGTGYCSLTYLRDLPLHEVKIDRSFVMTLEPGSTDAAIVQSTVSLAKALGLRTVAEGVETPIGLDTLRRLGCDIVQGYLLGRPMPADKISRLPLPDPLRGEVAAQS